MRTHLRHLLLGLALLCAWAPLAHAAPKKSVLGVFLPTTLDDGKQRFDYAEALAAKLGAVLEQQTAAKSFGRYEDFAKAISDGQLDFAVVDAWAAVQLGSRVSPVAFAPLGGETSQRWAIISYTKDSVKELAGKRLALTKGAASVDIKFFTNVVLGGDLDAKKHFKLVSVPNVESALKMLEAKGAEAALVPAAHVPKDARVLYRSSRVPGAVLVGVKDAADELEQNLRKLEPVAPFGAFMPVQGREYEEFRRLLVSGPPRRQPLLVDSTPLRVDAEALVKTDVLQPVLPSFVDALEVSPEQPDD
jgi:hypothetical protein